MIVADIFELTIVGVFDRGVPNRERIALQANDTVNLGRYGLMIGVRGDTGSAFPIRDNLLWFGDGFLEKGDWLFVYTGPGQPKVTKLPSNEERLISAHWGRTQTVLHNPDIVPILFRVDAVQVPNDVPMLSKK